MCFQRARLSRCATQKRLCRFAHDRLRAERATASVDWNLAQAFGAFLGGRIGRGWAFSRPGDESVDRRHHEEIDGGCDQNEADYGGDEFAYRKYGSTNCEGEPGELVRLANQKGDEGVDEVFYEGGDHGAESSADDHADCEIDDVSAKNKLFESG
jgi:hypothetical protein